MRITRQQFGPVAYYLTFAAAVSALFSIAVCQILMGMALVALLVSRNEKRLPPVALPLALFFGGTVVSMLVSGDPVAGLPQLRKFYVFAILWLVYSTFRGLRQVIHLAVAWFVVAAASALVSLVQFYLKWRGAREAGEPFYQYYVGERITGFMSHWMTFGGEMMITVLLLVALLFFVRLSRPGYAAALAGAAVLGLAIVAGFTRSIWLATAGGGLYLIWFWRRKLILLAPVALALGLWLGPESVQARFLSLFRPHGELDSNQHRIVTWRTGWEIIKANPWFGLGPENVGRHFEEYVPPDIPRPLPEGWYGHLHNIYLHYAAERGVPTMLFLMWLLGKVLFDFWRELRRGPPPEVRFVLHGAAASVLAVLIAGIFELNLGDTEVLTMFLTVVACGYVAIRESPAPAIAATVHG